MDAGLLTPSETLCAVPVQGFQQLDICKVYAAALQRFEQDVISASELTRPRGALLVVVEAVRGTNAKDSLGHDANLHSNAEVLMHAGTMHLLMCSKSSCRYAALECWQLHHPLVLIS